MVVKVGVIGAGIQAKAAHLPTFAKLSDVEVVGIADVNEKPAKALAKKFGIQNIYTDYQDLLESDVDLISICTPHKLHRQMAVDTANAGKHILIEKPMATSVKDADEILSAVDENKVKLGVVQNYRLFPAIQDAKNRIDSGRVGKIVSIHGYGHVFQSFGSRSTPWILEEGGAGIIEDFGSHLIDIILYLNSFNKIKQIYAMGGNFDGGLDMIASCQILMEFTDKSTVSLDLSCLSGAKESGVYVQGVGGSLHVDIRSDHLRETHQFNTPIDDMVSTYAKFKGISKGVISGDYFTGAKTYYRPLFQNMVDSIQGDDEIFVSGTEARLTALVIESAVKSLKSKQPLNVLDLQ